MKRQNSCIIRNSFCISRLFTFVAVAAWLLFSCQSPYEITNPYSGVDWSQNQQYKANLHTHSTRSDGSLNPHTVVDRYQELGYHILAITDHNEVTWPWTGFSGLEPSQRWKDRIKNGEATEEQLVYEDRNPQQSGMLAIQGNELSRHHHMGSFFNDHNGTTTEEESLKATAEKNGLVTFMHPGRYQRGVDWYVDLYLRYSHLVGAEVYNQGDRYPKDRILWDSILVRLMPDRPVWGFSNDDMHGEKAIGRNWNVFILPELSEEWLRRGMTEGRFLFNYAPKGHSGPEPPKIKAININARKPVIEIVASAYDSVLWISGSTVVQRGPKIDLRKCTGLNGYVRAELHGAEQSITGTQPFGIVAR